MKQVNATVVSIVVPVCNEARQIADLMRRLQQAPLPPLMKREIIVVDDASTDGTCEFLREMPCTANLEVIFHERNRGKGAAIRTALEAARGDFVLIQDADLEYDPNDYPALLTPLAQNQANVVYGVRPDRPERGFAYYFGAKLMTTVTNLLFRAGIHDEATCYKAFRCSLLRGIRLNCERFEFCPEVTAKVRKSAGWMESPPSGPCSATGWSRNHGSSSRHAIRRRSRGKLFRKISREHAPQPLVNSIPFLATQQLI
jgi:dolichol-phosphate mannosyltransferase